ncbi:MAG TPA: cyclodeaminase/cyclohydrolase family protein [Pseudonocardia sp.]
MSGESFADQTVGAVLDAVAARQPSPSAGAVIALSVASAAALTAMAARYAEPAELRSLADQADRARAQLVELADRDGPAYAEVLAAGRLPAADPDRAGRRTAALTLATEVPLDIARVAASVAALAARLAEAGNPNLVGDARAAVLLAEAGVRASAELVHLNVRRGALDPALSNAADRLVQAAGPDAF